LRSNGETFRRFRLFGQEIINLAPPRPPEPMVRNPIALIPYLFAFAFALGGYLWHVSDSLPGLGHTSETGTATIGGPFALHDQDNALRHDTDFRGRFMLVFFGYTHCPDVCPTLLGVMDDALAKLGPKAKEVAPLFITTDPERDTPPMMKQYLAAFGAKFVGLTGSLAAVTQAASEYRVYIKKVPLGHSDYGIDHSSTVYLMGRDGRFVTFYDETTGPDAMADDLRKRL
jgi:protein SCO1/2